MLVVLCRWLSYMNRISANKTLSSQAKKSYVIVCHCRVMFDCHMIRYWTIINYPLLVGYPLLSVVTMS